MEKACRESTVPAEVYQRGFFSFASPEEIERDFADVGTFEIHSEHKLLDFIELRQSIARHRVARSAKPCVIPVPPRVGELLPLKGPVRIPFATQTAFHVGEAQTPLGKRISWGRKGQRRSSMLRNSAGGKVWQYGVSASPCFLAVSSLQAQSARDVRGTRLRQSGRCRHRRRRRAASATADDLQGLAQQGLARPSSWPFSNCCRASRRVLRCPSPPPAPSRSTPGRCCSRRPSRPRCRTRMEDDAEESDDSTLGMFNPEDED